MRFLTLTAAIVAALASVHAQDADGAAGVPAVGADTAAPAPLDVALARAVAPVPAVGADAPLLAAAPAAPLVDAVAPAPADVVDDTDADVAPPVAASEPLPVAQTKPLVLVDPAPAPAAPVVAPAPIDTKPLARPATKPLLTGLNRVAPGPIGSPRVATAPVGSAPVGSAAASNAQLLAGLRGQLPTCAKAFKATCAACFGDDPKGDRACIRECVQNIQKVDQIVEAGCKPASCWREVQNLCGGECNPKTTDQDRWSCRRKCISDKKAQFKDTDCPKTWQWFSHTLLGSSPKAWAAKSKNDKDTKGPQPQIPGRTRPVPPPSAGQI